MHTLDLRVEPLISFLFEFIAAAVVIPVVIAVVVAVPLLEFLLPVIAVIAVGIASVIPVITLAVLLCESFDEGRFGEFQLSVGKIRQLALDGVVVDHLFMPV